MQLYVTSYIVHQLHEAEELELRRKEEEKQREEEMRRREEERIKVEIERQKEQLRVRYFSFIACK